MVKRVIKNQDNAKECFVCGKENESGLMAEFYELEDGTVAALAKAQSFHQSYPHTVHGGVSAALLDETIGRAIKVIDPDVWGVTLEISTVYKMPVPYDEQIIVTGRITENGDKVFCGEGEIILPSGDIAVMAKGKFYKMPAQRLIDMGAAEDMMQLYLSENDPKEINIPEKVCQCAIHK
ncbi:MAG: PaaI family thioesterase [Clostridiales bacterium]|nr:PaaI family thioesterase [Clostridiales bacterium]